MNRNLILFLIFIVVATSAFFIWKSRKDPSTNMERTESNFKIADINTIGRILITNKEGMRSDLKRVDDHWIVNDQHRVRKTNIDHLLRGISRQTMDHIPSKAATNNILPTMAVNGIHVEIFDLSGNKMLGYYIGGVTQDERSTYFIKEGSDQPYGLVDPGFDGSLRVRYALRPVDWRDIRFWIEDTEQIDTLKVHYPKDRQYSFMIIKKGGSYDVKPLFTTTPLKDNANKVKIESYLTTLDGLACENFLVDSPEKDSIVQSLPFMAMDMIYKDTRSYLRFFPVGMPAPQLATTEVPRYFLDYNGKDFMIAQHEVVKGALRPYDYFFE